MFKVRSAVLTERLVPEGNWFKARAGRLIIGNQDSNHDFAVWWSQSGTPVLTARLFPEGSLFKAHAGRLRLDIQDSNHNFEE